MSYSYNPRDKIVSVRIPEQTYNCAVNRHAKIVGRTKGTISNLVNILLDAFISGALDGGLAVYAAAGVKSQQISFDDLRGHNGI